MIGMSAGQSRTPVKIIIDGVGEATGEFIKVRAPLTVGAIVKMLPLRGRLHAQGEGYSFILGIQRGTEKAVKNVKAGTIAYWPMQDALIIYKKDTKPYSPVNKVGEITGNLDLFKDLKSGVRIKVEKT